MVRIFRLLAALTLGSIVTACGSNARSAPDFTLRDDGGRPWTLSQQHGDGVLLTFGYTHCPDTCPTTLAKLERLTQTLGARASQVEVAFITIDPQRDTPLVMHRFLAQFAKPGDSRLIGLTGTSSQIDALKSAYHVWSAKIRNKHGAYDYNEAHTAMIFFIDGRGQIRSLHADDDSEASLAAALQQIVG